MVKILTLVFLLLCSFTVTQKLHSRKKQLIFQTSKGIYWMWTHCIYVYFLHFHLPFFTLHFCCIPFMFSLTFTPFFIFIPTTRDKMIQDGKRSHQNILCILFTMLCTHIASWSWHLFIITQCANVRVYLLWAYMQLEPVNLAWHGRYCLLVTLFTWPGCLITRLFVSAA